MNLPRLRRDQYEIAAHPAKIKVLSMGRRWGKTVLGGALVGLVLHKHGRVAWIAPTYKNTRPMWRWLNQSLAEDVKAKIVTINRSERTIETKRGGFLGIYSGENIDSARGEAFNLVVMDEAARLPEDAWTDAIMPTLADFDGDAVLISTPKGRNWFYTEWMRGAISGHDHASWQAPTHRNPMPTIRRAAMMAKERVSVRAYRQEWLAEFVEDGGVFRRVMEAATAKVAKQAKGSAYVFGVDWGKHNDFTVIAVIDAKARSMVAMERFNQIDYALQLNRLLALADDYHPAVIVAEANSMGDPLIEQLQRMGLPVQPFVTTNATKTVVIEALALAFERGDIRILSDPVLVSELQAYEMKRLPSGLMRYSAPEGMHDDTVMALALAWAVVAEPARGGTMIYEEAVSISPY